MLLYHDMAVYFITLTQCDTLLALILNDVEVCSIRVVYGVVYETLFTLTKVSAITPVTPTCDFTCLDHLGQYNTDRIISILCHSPKVTKASTEVTVTCHCR
jgi:hypothetical protein